MAEIYIEKYTVVVYPLCINDPTLVPLFNLSANILQTACEHLYNRHLQIFLIMTIIYVKFTTYCDVTPSPLISFHPKEGSSKFLRNDYVYPPT